jgi:type III secretion protein U
LENSSEERSLPASKRKLREARRKGQVAKSTEFITAAHIIVGLLFLYAFYGSVYDRIIRFFDTASTLHARPFNEALLIGLDAFRSLMLYLAVPLVLVVVSIFIVSGFISTFGPVFSAEPLKPDIKRLNPVEGFKKIFSVRNLTDFLKSLLKVVALGVAFVILVYTSIDTLVRLPNCGEACLGPAFFEIIYPIAIVCIIAFLIVGGVDLLIQRALFLREMRMTRTEMKQETKNQDGNPLVRREQRRLRNRAATDGKVFRGLQHATLVIMGEDRAIGIRYVAGQTPIPLVVSLSPEGQLPNPGDIRSQTKAPLVRNPGLATRLAQGHRPGERINRNVFKDVAEILVRQGQV